MGVWGASLGSLSSKSKQLESGSVPIYDIGEVVEATGNILGD